MISLEIMLRFSTHDVIKWKHFPRYWPFVRGIHRSPVDSSHKGQWHGALMFYLICAWTKAWTNNRVGGDLRRRHRVWNDITVMNKLILHFYAYLVVYAKVGICKKKRGTCTKLIQIFSTKQYFHDDKTRQSSYHLYDTCLLKSKRQ